MDSNHHIEIQTLAACLWPSQEWREAASQTRAPEGNRTPVPSLEGWCLVPFGHWSEESTRRDPSRRRPEASRRRPEVTPATFALAARYSDRWSLQVRIPAGESNSALRVKGPLYHASMLTGNTSRSAREDSNLRAPVYQTGAWTGSATGGKSGGADSNRLLGGHSPALYLVSYAPACCQWGSRSVSIRRTPAYEAGALPSELQEQGIPPEGIEPSRARAHDVLSVARMRSATAANRVAPAGIEPAPRWASTSRSTGELQEPGRSRRDSNPQSPERQSGALAIAPRLQRLRRQAASDGTANE